MLVLALVWWAWSAFAWVTDAEDPDSTGFRLALMLGACLIFIAGLALPQAFGSEGLLFAVSYACVRFMHLALYVVASRRGRASMAAIAGFSVTVVLGMALLIAGAFAHGSLRIALWVLAAAIDYIGPAWLTRDRLRGLQRVAVVHFAERYALFIIICLGESIVEMGVGASQHPLTAATIAASVLGVLTACGFWWVYFDRSAGLAESRLRTHDEPVLAAADAYSYLHPLARCGDHRLRGGCQVHARARRTTTPTGTAAGTLLRCVGLPRGPRRLPPADPGDARCRPAHRRGGIAGPLRRDRVDRAVGRPRAPRARRMGPGWLGAVAACAADPCCRLAAATHAAG
jgi:Bacterial low temperature requirement A protein (LtrA)